ncbi:MAG TPA: hypothetical protein PLQ02_00765 [Methanofastidiosum sp.]|jgi:hypothetical protein|nr:hypothetical protein [Methanofastidiosum sp.]
MDWNLILNAFTGIGTFLLEIFGFVSIIYTWKNNKNNKAVIQETISSKIQAI